ncbi:MAG: hypothetical protein HOG25_03310 [Gammaproteobacteria bacterium]|nr:hypothetical protein [Gammaproteobacteria bacterium]
MQVLEQKLTWMMGQFVGNSEVRDAPMLAKDFATGWGHINCARWHRSSKNLDLMALGCQKVSS